jgi:hypothetical protein
MFPAWFRLVINWFALADAVLCLLFALYWLLFSKTQLQKDSYSMSDKDRNKKDGQNKDKKNRRCATRSAPGSNGIQVRDKSPNIEPK